MPKRRALVVGVDNYNYDGIANLSGACRDASKLAGFLENVSMTERFHVDLLLSPTAADVFNALRAIRDELKNERDPVFVFYFAGHGTRYCDGNSQVLLCRDADEYTLDGTTDAGAICPKALGRVKDEIHGNKFFCFDVCRSQVDRKRGGGDVGGTGQFRDAFLSRQSVGDSGNFWMLSSCDDRERASDDGKFVQAMISSMRNSIGNYGCIELGDAFVTDVSARLGSKTQHPTPCGRPFVLWGERKRVGGFPPPVGDPWGQDAARTAGALKTVNLNGVEYRFRWCPAGSFMMGSIGFWVDADEKPVHKVTLTRGFWMQETPVTQRQWESIMGNNPSWFSKSGGGSKRVKRLDTSNFPVECVSWNDIAGTGGFIEKLNANSSGFKFRLPTEAEFEYAARSGQNYKYSGSDNIDEVAWCDESLDKGHTHPVGTKKANGWGLYDLSGNVCEWCNDWYDKNYYNGGSMTDPRGPNVGSGRVRRVRRVDRGGGWDYGARSCRSAYRGYDDPGSRYNNLGFRLLLESAQ